MKALLIIQRILALAVGICGVVLMFSEVAITSPASEQLALTLGGIALVAVAVGWGLLTGVEEDLFLRYSRR